MSASEPYILLKTPSIWQYNGGILLNKVEHFSQERESKQKEKIQELLEMGISDDETILSGNIVDYTYKQAIYGYILT